MNKHFTDEKTGISYTLQNDYYLSDLTLPTEEVQPIGICGTVAPTVSEAVLKDHLLQSANIPHTEGYLVDINRQAEKMFSRLVNQMAECEGITEKLKVENQMEWVSRMNNIRNRVMEIVNNELIYN